MTLLGAAVSLTVLVLSGCTDVTPQPKPVRPVLTSEVMLRPYWQQHVYSGEIEARNETALGFRVAGKLSMRNVEVGDRVSANTLIARLDPEDYRLRLMEAEAQLTAAAAELSKAAADQKRYASLLKRELVSDADYQGFSNAYNVARARKRQAEASLAVARNQADYTDLHADHEGIVTAVEAEQGQVVAAGQTVVRLALCCEKEAVISVPENRLDEIRLADEITVELWALPDAGFAGKVREVSPGADPVTRTYRVRISLPEAGDDVQFGMTASVRVKRRLHEQVALVPATALFQHDSAPAVWILDPESTTVTLRTVTVAAYRQDGVLVSDGLTDGDRIVTAGVHLLVEGQTVRLANTGGRR
jgi:multidrug efflux system membrane fusion protein